MWVKTHSKTFKNITVDDVWRAWTNVNSWAEWQTDLDYCRMEGAFQVGNHFILKPKGAQPVKITITQMIEGKQFTDRTDFFCAKMYDTHTVEKTTDGVKISSTLKVTGPLSWLWIRLVVRDIANTIPDQIDSLINFLRKKN